MENVGFIKLHRKLFDSKIFVDKPCEWLKIWIFILGNVNFADNGTKTGSKFLQYSYIAKECRLTYNQVSKCLAWLKEEGMIGIERRPNGGIIEVARWSDYQDENDIPKANQKRIRSESEANAINKNERIKEYIYNFSEEITKQKKEHGETVSMRLANVMLSKGWNPAKGETFETFNKWFLKLVEQYTLDNKGWIRIISGFDTYLESPNKPVKNFKATFMNDYHLKPYEKG